jgi:hypothetical protein
MLQTLLVIAMIILVIAGIILGVISILPPQKLNSITPEILETPETPESSNSPPENSRDITPRQEPSPSVPEGCYDILTMREGSVYLFQSYAPLQDGINPKIFSDLPSYRVWTEHFLYEGIRCPILFYDPSLPEYIHPEEKAPEDIPIARSQIANGQRKRYEVIVRKTYGNDPTKPYVVLPSGGSSGDPEYDFYKGNGLSSSKKGGAMEGFKQESIVSKNKYMRNAATDAATYVGQDGVETDYILKSRYDGLQIGYDEPLPDESITTFRDASKKHVDRLVKEKYPELHGVKLKRTGVSKYQIEEITPERQNMEEDPQQIDNGGHWTAWGKQMPLDLLAYGGTVVPSGSLFDTIFSK